MSKISKINFPTIDYQFWLESWNEIIGDGHVYSNRNMERFIKFEGNVKDCTDEIIRLVRKNPIQQKNVLRVVDLINSWGGKSCRLFYASTNKNLISPREELETDKDYYDTYIKGVKLALKGDTECLDVFKTLRGLGPSYASKHAYFWSFDSDRPLIIVDSKIAGALGYSTIDKLLRKFTYDQVVKGFSDKAIAEFKKKSPDMIEKSLFTFHNFYFLNDNSGWKNKMRFTDYNVAVELASKLF